MGGGAWPAFRKLHIAEKGSRLEEIFRPTRAENICISFFCPGAHFFVFLHHIGKFVRQFQRSRSCRINRRYGNECAKGRESAWMKHLIRQWEFSLWLAMIIDQSGYDRGEFNFPENFAKQQRRETWAWGFLGVFFCSAETPWWHCIEADKQIAFCNFSCFLHRKCYFSRKILAAAGQDCALSFDRFLFIYLFCQNFSHPFQYLRIFCLRLTHIDIHTHSATHNQPFSIFLS